VAEALLPGSKFHRYRRDSHTVLRSTSLYSVHEDVHQHLDFGEQLTPFISNPVSLLYHIWCM